jgi:hypothetical protein
MAEVPASTSTLADMVPALECGIWKGLRSVSAEEVRLQLYGRTAVYVRGMHRIS